jgi:hypothetical protein
MWTWVPTTSYQPPHQTGGIGNPQKWANSSNLNPHDINAERVQPTSTQAQQINGSAMGIITQSVSKHLEGLLPPIIKATGNLVTGKDIEKLRLQNKRHRHALQEQEARSSAWTTYQGDTVLPPSAPLPEKWRGEMCPSGIATSHPAGELLKEWAQLWCPTRTGRPWTKEEIWEAVKRGPHRSALSDEALDHFMAEAVKKVTTGQCRIVEWDSMKDNPPGQLKISPIAAIPHKLRGFRSILDLSFSLRLKNGGILHSVNDTTLKMAPKGALDKLRHAFLALQDGKGLLSPCNRLLRKQPDVVYFHRNPPLFSAIKDMRTLLRKSTTRPTRCKELVAGWPDYVGVWDASSFGVGGVIIGKLSECRPTVFQLQ